MLNFCTLFDTNYITRGLTMYRSLEKICSDFRLYVFAFDDNAYRFLSDRQDNWPRLTVISLKEFEDAELLKVKPTRSVAEYCWTCTPSTILYCLKQFNLDHCTYIDADMFFYADPAVLIEEMGNKPVLISEHRYTPAYDQSDYSGIYCVQFMCFRHTAAGLNVLNWWRDRCLEWCYARLEDGKFGDQKYLDDWTTRFANDVHLMQHLGGGVAPWNLQQYEFNDNLMMTEKATGKTYPLIFFHYHGLKFYTDNKVSFCGPLYDITPEVKRRLYFPYVKQLLSTGHQLRNEGLTGNSTGAYTQSPSKASLYIQFLKDTASQIKKGKLSFLNSKYFNFSRHYHIYYLEQFV